MKRIKINYAIGTTEEEIIEVGSYEYNAEDVTDKFIENALNKSIGQMKKGKKMFIFGMLTVFIDRVRQYEVVFLGDPNRTIKPKIYKL